MIYTDKQINQLINVSKNEKHEYYESIQKQFDEADEALNEMWRELDSYIDKFGKNDKSAKSATRLNTIADGIRLVTRHKEVLLTVQSKMEEFVVTEDKVEDIVFEEQKKELFKMYELILTITQEWSESKK